MENMDFYDIALAKFLQSFPDLSNFIVTFKDMTDELSSMRENSEISVGCFIVKAGSSYFYIPVIAKGSNVYPVDSMFSMDKQKFIPLTQKTVIEIINSNSFQLGQKTKIPQTVPGNPSVYELVNPPRTGKFVYASSSRLLEFLHLIPNDVKDFVKNKITENKKIYNGLNSMFGLKEVMEPLMKKTPSVKPVENSVTPSVSVITEGNGLAPEEIRQILSVGYVVKGNHKTNRIAVTAEDYNRVGMVSQSGYLEGNREYEFVLEDGSLRTGYVPILSRINASKNNKHGNFTLYENGDFSFSYNHVIQGNPKPSHKCINKLFDFRPPVMLKNLEGGETFALFTPSMELIGVYRGYESPIRNNEGVVIKRVSDLMTHSPVNIFGYRNVSVSLQEENSVFVPYDVLVVLLSKDITYDLEKSVNNAQRKRSLSELVALGSAMDIGYDGVEFSINGSPIGNEPKLVEILVVKEGVEPSVANSFIKQAKEQRCLKVYLSKKADFVSGIPQYGEVPPPHPKDQLQQGDGGKVKLPLQDDAINNIEGTLGLEDPQTTEASILTELLQAPDMYQYIGEYVPDIEEAIDKLGRTLFLLRINLDTFSEGNNPSEVFSFVNQIRNVYRMLGDSLIKLQQILNMNQHGSSTEVK